ncbi:hypothetical protein EDB83DRAFT_2321293 [Lactarius deliciosus]|nr:hypothetical protein EDB83DRAFT_2321293 [Lactarius deliciosus]
MSPRHRRRHRSDVASLSLPPSSTVASSSSCAHGPLAGSGGRGAQGIRVGLHPASAHWCTVSSVLGGDPWTCMRRGVEATATGLRQRRWKVLEGWGSTEMPLAWVGEVGDLKDSGAVAATRSGGVAVACVPAGYAGGSVQRQLEDS